MTASADDSAAALSRTGFTHPYGKLERMPSVSLTSTTLEELRTMVSRSGMGSFAEYVRLVIEAHVHGPEHVANLAVARVRAVKSCGCLKRIAMAAVGAATRTHGMSSARIYGTWERMKARCLDPSDRSFKNYGGRGIKVCDRWLSFEAFFEDMGEKPVGMSIERIDNDGPYSPGNCKWATALEQTRNRRNSHNVTVDGVSRPLIDWCSEYGVTYSAAHSRIFKRGWSPARAVREPIRGPKKADPAPPAEQPVEGCEVLTA